MQQVLDLQIMTDKSEQKYCEEIAKESIVELNFNVADKGWHKGKISLQDYPITFDDNFYFSFEVKPQLNIQHIFQEAVQIFSFLVVLKILLILLNHTAVAMYY